MKRKALLKTKKLKKKKIKLKYNTINIYKRSITERFFLSQDNHTCLAE